MNQEYFYEVTLTKSNDTTDVYQYIVLADDYDYAMKHAKRIADANGYEHIQLNRISEAA